jgi:hypothetical protein
MDRSTNPLEVLWDKILSRQPEQIRKAFMSLRSDEQQSVLTHIKHMATDPGWHPEQRISAQAAIEALKEWY